MAYRLKREESIGRGLRRLARKELRAADQQLRRAAPPPPEAIHEARKSVKKVRAIADLLDAGGARGLRASRKKMRRVNRVLSCLRDRDAVIDALRKLKGRDEQQLSEHAFARLQRRLAERRQSATEAALRKRERKAVTAELRSLRRAAADWRPANRRFGPERVEPRERFSMTTKRGACSDAAVQWEQGDATWQNE